MKNDITIPDHFPELKEENLKAAAKRREDYALVRDLQAEGTNKSIERRLAKESEMQKVSDNEGRKQIKCEKCGTAFSVEITTQGLIDCPECKQKIKVD